MHSCLHSVLKWPIWANVGKNIQNHKSFIWWVSSQIKWTWAHGSWQTWRWINKCLGVCLTSPVAQSQNNCWLLKQTRDGFRCSLNSETGSKSYYEGFVRCLTRVRLALWHVPVVYTWARHYREDRDKKIWLVILTSCWPVRCSPPSFSAQPLFLPCYLLPWRRKSITAMAPVPATMGTWVCFGLHSANFGAKGDV